MATKPKVEIFPSSELIDDAAAETEELQGDVATAVAAETPAEGAAKAEPVKSEEPAQLSERTQERIRRLIEENKQLRTQESASREKWARLDERSKQIREATEAGRQATAEAQRAAQRPDEAVDPVGAKLWDLEERDKQREAAFADLRKQLTETTSGVQQQQQSQDFNNWVVFEAQSFARKQSDYFDAAKFAFDWRVNWWKQLAPNAPEEVIQGIVGRESEALAALARQFGGDFPAAVYGLAKQMGYAPQSGTSTQAQATNGAQGNAQRLQQVQRGLTVQGLSRASGGGNEAASRYANITASQLAELSEREFSAAMANPTSRAELIAAMAKHEGVSAEEAARLFPRHWSPLR